MEDKKSEAKEDDSKNEETKPLDHGSFENAGPSGTIHLPGAIQNTKIKPGISKSEHNIRTIITSSDVANALNSLSFGTPNTALKNLNIKEIKIPILDKEDSNLTIKEADSTTLLDLKKFMASCFKVHKENPVIFTEIPLQSVHTATVPNNLEVPNVTESCNVQTECIPLREEAVNEVIVTNRIEPKLSKPEKKKTSGNGSERSADLAIAQRDSLSSIGSNVCRICMTRGRERLISPCNCKGSLANVHLSCLERWLNQVGRNHCELCGFSYPAIRTPRYTVLQALRLWFGNPRNRSHLQSDCLIFWLLSTVTAGLLAVCIVGTQYFVIEGNKFGKIDAGVRKEEGISHRVTETAMDFFMAIVLCGYSVTVYLLWKDHYVMWNRWRRANVNVRLLLAPDVNPVPFAPRNRYNIV